METEKKKLDSRVATERREATLKAFNEMARELQSAAKSASTEQSLQNRDEALSATACRK